jgi:Fe-S oxidoreductase
VSNWFANTTPMRALAQRIGGIDRRRPLPRFVRDTVPRWFERRAAPLPSRGKHRGPLVFLADSFTSYTEPEIGKAAIELLELAGWNVQLVSNACCGRSLVSKGLLDEARAAQGALIDTVGPRAMAGAPIVGCEPSCVFTLGDELPALTGRSDAALAVGHQARLVDDLLVEAIDDGSLTLDPASAVANRRIVFHAHCHQKAARATSGSVALLERIPGATVDVLDAGCCGMAGSFGFEHEHYDLSMAIGGMRLFPAVHAAPSDALIVATGVSCRQQIAHGTRRRAMHPVLLIREALQRPER